MLTHILKPTFICLLLLTIKPVHADIVNGSFEEPVIAGGAFETFPGGSTSIPGWTVLGIEVSTVDSVVGSNGIAYIAQDGQQWLDLAGAANPSTTNGITQDVSTIIGSQYELSFYVGSATDGQFVFPSTVDLAIDGSPRISFSNNAAPTDMLDWQQFTHSFSAQNATTTIAFFDGTGPSNFVSALDNVTLTLVPEPSSLLLASLAGVLFCSRRRHR